ncbi:MAG TPA: LCP family protein [Solirubrobacteraceae bacterium]|nr:LCP family protein [Solirubrobacteraceae bacterium]
MPAEPPRHGRRVAVRFLLGALGLLVVSGVASAALALNEVGKLVDALGQSRAVKLAPTMLAPSARGTPETLLLVGNDERPAPKENPGAGPVLPHSNEMLLVRIDPSKPTISMLSIPRELWVPIHKPDGEVESNRINSAYTFGYLAGGTAGGVKLMLQTIKQVMGVTVNHVFVTNFKKFKHAVNEMGCVYMTVDKRYHHVNEPGGEQYFEINLQPGYQRLCGLQALEFVANRHESTSLIRDSRDQRFLLEVKAQYGASLFANREKFEHIVGRAVETDLHSEEQILALLELLVESAGKPVRQVRFPVTLHSVYDTATPQQIEEAVHSFMSGTAAINRRRLSRAVHSVHTATHHHAAAPAPALGLSPTPASTLEEARVLTAYLPFAVEAPRVQVTSAEAEPDTLRWYDIRGPNRVLYPAYVMVVDQGELGQFYDIQGSTWTSSPLLGTASQQLQLGARSYSLYYDGEHLKTVAWREGNAAYWIENTLTNALSPQQMVAIAQQTTPLGTSAARRARTQVAPRQLNLPPPAAPTAATAWKVGALLGFASLLVVLALAVLVAVRQRELRALRTQVANAMALEARSGNQLPRR